MKDINRLLIFDLKGSIAHFRKFYTSSSSLSYSFPPRTTIIGLIGALLGRERDSYYEEFGCDNCKIALSIRKPLRKIMQTVNYIRTKKEDGYASAEGVIKRFFEKQISKYPTPIELVMPPKLTDKILYRIYFFHQNTRVMDELATMVKNGKTKYPLYFGLSEFLAESEFIADVAQQNIKKCSDRNAVAIASVCNLAHIVELTFDNLETAETVQYIDEKMPLEFATNREIKSAASFIYEKNQRMIKAILNIPYMEVTYTDKEQVLKENITFME